MTCVEGSSLGFPSNFGISDGNFVGILAMRFGVEWGHWSIMINLEDLTFPKRKWCIEKWIQVQRRCVL
jgi:hypothetical protein